MRRILVVFAFILLTFCISFKAGAHQYHPFLKHSAWVFNCGNFGYSWYEPFKSGSVDTMVAGKYYYKIYSPPNSAIGYCREDTVARKVYAKYTATGTEILLYDFSLKPGDMFLSHRLSYTGAILTDTLNLALIDSISSPIGRLHFSF